MRFPLFAILDRLRIYCEEGKYQARDVIYRIIEELVFSSIETGVIETILGSSSSVVIRG